MSNVDYSQIPVPDGKPPEEFTYNERRAEILKLLEQKGHQWGFNKAELARRYGIDRKMVYKDFDRVKDWYRDRIGSDAKEASDLAYRRIVQEHMDNGDYEKARRALDSWNSWLEDRGIEEKEPDTIRHEGIEVTSEVVTVDTETDNSE
jgi:hypothetical protein